MNKRWKVPRHNRTHIHLDAAHRHLTTALDESADIDWSTRPDLVEILADTLSRVRAQLDQLDARIAGRQ
jgi:hypothetical protein